MDAGKRASTPAPVQDQIIENLRRDQGALNKSLEMERNRHQQELAVLRSEIKGQQREMQLQAKTISHQEVKINELEHELRKAREALNEERRGSQTEEALNTKALKEMNHKLRQEEECAGRHARESALLRVELEQAKEALSLERKAADSLIREHNKEVKALREEVHSKSCDAYKELQNRAAKEREEFRALREESEKTYKIIEHDFRAVINQKDEELRQALHEIKELQKELEEQRRISLVSTDGVSGFSSSDAQQNPTMRSLRQEVMLLKKQIKKMEKQLQEAGDAIFSEVQKERSKYEKVLVEDDKQIRADVTKLLQVLKSKDQTILRQRREMLRASNAMDKLRAGSFTRLRKDNNGEVTGKKKPQLPAKSAKLLECKAASLKNEKTQRVKDIVRQLQEKENGHKDGKLNGGSNGKKLTKGWSRIIVDAEPIVNNNSSTNKTIADLQAIDEDIERLRNQIEERDRMITRLKEEGKAKDQQLRNLAPLNIQCQKDSDSMAMSCSSPDSEGSLDSKSSSPTPSSNTNYLELLTNHLRQQRKELRRNSSASSFNDNDTITDENRNVGCTCCTDSKASESSAYLALEEEVKVLRKREATLRSEAAELREQNELMEFRILELEECNSEDVMRSLPSCRNTWLDDVSDSGVMSLPTSEDLTSDSDPGDTFGNSSSEIKLTGVATVFSNVRQSPTRPSRTKATDCLQESGIFEDSTASPSDSVILRASTHCKACQTDSDYPSTPSKTGDLTAELSKLTEIQKRIQEKGESIGDNAELRAKSPYSFYISDYIGFYEDKLSQLEEKIKIYESFGDARDNLLKKRLEKETFQTYEIRILKEKVAAMEESNRQLEEERCEFEEAENDSRLECQRLQLRVRELLDVKVELEDKIELLTRETTENKHKKSKNDQIAKLKQEVDRLREESINDKFRLEELETCIEERDAKIEAILQIKVLEASSDTKSFISKALGLQPDDGTGDATVSREEDHNELKTKIDSLEKTNQAFINALSQADIVWANLEEDYKTRIATMEKEHAELITTIENQHQEKLCAMTKENEAKLLEIQRVLERQTEDHSNEMKELKAEYVNQMKTLRCGFENLQKLSEENAQRLGNELSEKSSEIKSLKEHLEKQIMSARGHSEQHLLESKKMIEQAREENEKLKKLLNEANEKLALANTLTTTHRTLNDQLEQMEKTVAKKEEDNNILKIENEKLMVKLSTLESELIRQKAICDEKLAQMDAKIQNVTKSLENEISHLNAEIIDKNKLVSDYEVTISELREEVDTLESNLSVLKMKSPTLF